MESEISQTQAEETKHTPEISLRRKVVFSLVGFLFLMVVTIAIGEIGVRLIGENDQRSGNFVVNGIRIKPYSVQTGEVLSLRMDRYISASMEGRASSVYDPLLGWTHPRGVDLEGASYNSQGIRTSSQVATEYPVPASEGKLRIAIFGDSFTAGAEVTYEESWGYQLEKFLNDSGIDAEVLNFGVGGYGIDQAFLRWENEGPSVTPDIVIFGLQLENVKRNMNLYRPFYVANSNTTLTKPRFVLESDELRLINVPTVSPGLIPDLVMNFDSWELVDYEYFYDAEDYQDKMWRKSKLVATALELSFRLSRRLNEGSDLQEFHAMDSEPGRLAYTIIQEFKESTASNNAEFLIVHLPMRSELKALSNNKGGLEQSELLAKLNECCIVIEPGNEMVAEANASSMGSLFAPNGHPSAKANEVIAESISSFLIERQ